MKRILQFAGIVVMILGGLFFCSWMLEYEQRQYIEYCMKKYSHMTQEDCYWQYKISVEKKHPPPATTFPQ